MTRTPAAQTSRASAVVFDLYGTLLDIRSIEMMCAQETADPAAFVTLWRQKQLEYSWLCCLMDRYEDFWAVTAAALDYAADRLGVVLTPASRRRMMDAWTAVRAYPEVPGALARLAPRPLAVLSNASPGMLDGAVRSAGLRDVFAHLISVDEVRTYKPAAAVYALAEQRLRLPRVEVLFVSSNAWDAAGAKAFGLRVAWVNRIGQPSERLGIAPDLMVADLAELADRVTAEPMGGRAE